MLQVTGVDYAVSQIFLHARPQLALVAVFAVTTTIANLVNGSFAAIICGPAALAIAAAARVDPYVFALCVAVAANAAFVSTRLQMNRLAISFNGLSERDFTKTGAILVIIALLAYPVIAIKVFGL
jgi:di/tricarboxylate transporter